MGGRYVVYVDSTFGPFAFWGDDDAVTGASFVDERGEDSDDLPQHMLDCREQVQEYFAGRPVSFDVPLRPEGTEFQREVWREMCRIPPGQTRSYGQLAKAIGRPGGARAVGQACRCNPIGVIQPCHRVIGSDGNLVGFGGQTKDLSLKRALIEHEAGASSPTLEEYQDR